MDAAVDETTHDVRIALAGDLDLLVEKDVIDALVRAASTPGITTMRVDVTEITFIDASGLRSLLAGWHAAHDSGIAFELALTPNGRVAKLLALVGLDDHFHVSLLSSSGGRSQ